MTDCNVVDLHLHTTASDGSDTPGELISKARECGLKVISVTDHDTLVGIKTALRSEACGVKIVTGIEFSCHAGGDSGFDCHILGYGFDVDSPFVAAAVEHGRQMRLFKLEKRLEYLRETFGIEFTDQEIKKLRSYNSVAKPHLARLIIERGMADNVANAIDKYLNGAKFPDDRIDASEAISAIRSAGGVAVYAHPLGGEREKRLTVSDVIPRVRLLYELGIGGIECYYSRYSSSEHTALAELADSYGLCASSGSDYHGENKTVVLGCLSSDGKVIEKEKITILSALGVNI